VSVGDTSGVVISGLAYGKRSPVEFPHGICQVVLEASRDTDIETPEAKELCLYVVSGAAQVDFQPINEGQMAVLNAPCEVSIAAGSRIMFAGGDPLDGPRFLDWNFVASSKERLAKASADWRASIAAGFSDSWFTQPPGETTWIPLPGDPQPDPADHLPNDH
jgi:redox-sensitive bicupin YhaK (pirin superfamily)